jgi:hypothetical protein
MANYGCDDNLDRLVALGTNEVMISLTNEETGLKPKHKSVLAYTNTQNVTLCYFRQEENFIILESVIRHRSCTTKSFSM